MTEAQLDTIRTSFRFMMFRGQDLADAFFARLFDAQPILRSLFAADAWQRDRDLLTALGMLVKNLHRLDSITFLIEDAGTRCMHAGLQPNQLGMARDALIGAMRDTIPDNWNQDLENDWNEALNAALSIMIRAGGRARLRAA